jgi:hypothetical protein
MKPCYIEKIAFYVYKNKYIFYVHVKIIERQKVDHGNWIEIENSGPLAYTFPWLKA